VCALVRVRFKYSGRAEGGGRALAAACVYHGWMCGRARVVERIGYLSWQFVALDQSAWICPSTSCAVCSFTHTHAVVLPCNCHGHAVGLPCSLPHTC